ncbi:hypothetical protein N2152v2_006696 [Parachlorella kessleri]
MLATTYSTSQPAARLSSSRPAHRSLAALRSVGPCKRQRAQQLAAQANLLVELVGSAAAGAAAAAVTVVTAENKDSEIERVQTVQGALPIAGAVAADAIAHSIPGLNLLLGLVSEPVGAACGVAYLMSLVLSAPSVDPATLAPKGTILNAEKAQDVRAAVRVPFSQVIPTLVKVVDTSNDSSSGAGWSIGEGGLPKLPITSVAVVLGVGVLILEAAAHAPVLGLFLPRVLSVAGWLAVVGAVLDKRE